MHIDKGKVYPIACHEDRGGGIDIAVPFLQPWHLNKVGVEAMPWVLYSCEIDPVPTVQKAGWALRPVWMSMENLTPPGF